jgi:predicted RNase H-like HicB family nuclease
MAKVFKVHVRFDEDAQVYYVHETTVPGLHAESDTLDELRTQLLSLIPELLEANGVTIPRPRARNAHRSVLFELIQRDNIALAC